MPKWDQNFAKFILKSKKTQVPLSFLGKVQNRATKTNPMSASPPASIENARMGTMFQDPGTMFQDPGTMFQDPGTIYCPIVTYKLNSNNPKHNSNNPEHNSNNPEHNSNNPEHKTCIPTCIQYTGRA